MTATVLIVGEGTIVDRCDRHSGRSSFEGVHHPSRIATAALTPGSSTVCPFRHVPGIPVARVTGGPRPTPAYVIVRSRIVLVWLRPGLRGSPAGAHDRRQRTALHPGGPPTAVGPPVTSGVPSDPYCANLGGMTDTGITTASTTVDPQLDGDHERMSHIVLEGYKPKKGDFIPAGTSVVEGIVTGTAVKALCGKIWVPGRNPQRYPICPTCKEIAEAKGWKIPAH